MTQTPNYEGMSEEQLREIATRNHESIQHNALLIELIKRIMALPDPDIMTAEEKVKWIDFLAGLRREVLP